MTRRKASTTSSRTQVAAARSKKPAQGAKKAPAKASKAKASKTAVTKTQRKTTPASRAASVKAAPTKAAKTTVTAKAKAASKTKVAPSKAAAKAPAAKSKAKTASKATAAPKATVSKPTTAVKAAKKAALKVEGPLFEELTFRSQNAYLALLVNRYARRLRVIDFRAGAMPAKRLFIQNIARLENAHKIQIFIEKDEISAWTRVGFQREGTIPGFYKRSDGYLCGFFPNSPSPKKEDQDRLSRESERTINQAKKLVAELSKRKRPKAAKISREAVVALRDKGSAQGEALASFEPFARGADYLYFAAGGKTASPDNIMGVEYEECFGHAQLELWLRPDTEARQAAALAVLEAVTADLSNRHIVSMFTLADSQDPIWNGLLLEQGFRRTGLVPAGITLATGEVIDATLYTKKLDFLDDD